LQYRKTTYWVTVEGGYYALAKFVSEIESHAKILRVDDFSISPKEETPRVHLGQIHVSAFSRIEEKG
jgi:Tfp pilus assembly protein PilO